MRQNLIGVLMEGVSCTTKRQYGQLLLCDLHACVSTSDKLISLAVHILFPKIGTEMVIAIALIMFYFLILFSFD